MFNVASTIYNKDGFDVCDIGTIT